MIRNSLIYDTPYHVYMNQADSEGSSGGTAAAVTEAPPDSGGDKAASTPAAAPATVLNAADSAPEATKNKGTEGGYWPDDWRERAAKGDQKIMDRLGRYASPEAVTQALIDAQNKIRSGELKAPLRKDATPEELKTWREEQGIPETFDKYDLNLGDGLVVGENDRPMVDEFLKTAHERNLTNDQVKASLKTYYTMVEKQVQERYQQDQQIMEEAQEALRSEWGPQFKTNLNLVRGLLDRTTDQATQEKLFKARLGDGTPLGNSPEILKMLLSIALIDNPAGTVVPNASGDLLKSVDSELDKITDYMRKNRDAYNKDEKMQKRMRELIEAKEKMKSRKVA